MTRFSERLSTLSESAKRAEDIIDTARAKNGTRPDTRHDDRRRSLVGWITSNGVPLIIGTAVVKSYRRRRNKHPDEIAARAHRRLGLRRR
jgi:hypothetical protein